MAADSNEDAQLLPRKVARVVWTNLPFLLGLDVVIAVGAAPSILLLLGTRDPIPAIIVIPVTWAPLWIGTIASTDRLVCDERVTFRTFINNVKMYAGKGVRIAFPPALVAVSTVGSLELLRSHPNQRLILVPIFIGSVLLTLSVVAGFCVFSLATTGQLSGWTLWRASLELMATNPLYCIGTFALLALLFLAGTTLPSLLPVAPALLAVYLSALTRQAVKKSRRSVVTGNRPE